MNLPTDELIGLAWPQLWQVTALLAIVAVATRLVCRRRPHLAYVLWMLVILKCLTPPLWSSPTGLFSWAQLRRTAPTAEIRLTSVDAAAHAASPEAGRGSLLEKMMHPPKRSSAVSTPIGAETAVSAEMAEMPEPPRHWSLPWTAIAAAIWSLGVLTFGGVLLWKWIAYGRILRRSASLPSAELELLAARIAEQLGLRRTVRLRIVSEPIGPAVFGLWRPVVVIPAAILRDESLPSPFGRGAGGEGEPLRATALTLTLSQRERGLDKALTLSQRGLEEERLKQIEPIVAHELVHVRRGDAFVGVLQMAVQVLWWFHPLLWWANREMCRRREQCCDEEVLAGLGCSPAAYARCLLDVLECAWEGECCRSRRRLLSAVPGVGAAEITTTRLEHIMDDAKRFHRRTPRWTWGLLAMAMLLVLPGGAIVLGQNDQSESTKDAKGSKDAKEAKEIRGDVDRAPTLVEIAKANSATWNAIQAVDVEYVVATRCIENGKLTRDMQMPAHWSKAANKERLRKYPVVVKINESRFGDVPQPESHDYFFAGKTLFHLIQFDPEDTFHIGDRDPEYKNKRELSPGSQKGFSGQMTTDATDLSIDGHDREPLRYLWSNPPLDLGKILATWKASLRGKQTTNAGDTLWLIHAEYPTKDDKDRFAGTYIDIQVNANKGFLVQKTFCLANGLAHGEVGKGGLIPVSSCSVAEVKEFQDCGHGVFFPKKMEFRLIGELKDIDSKDGYYSTISATKLSVNSPLPADAFDFRFPENLEVQQITGNKSVKSILWGPDNKPGKTFESGEEYRRYAEKDEHERLSRRVKANMASKKPKDLVDRGEYYMHTKDYDAAIAAFSQVISTVPETEEAGSALSGRGFVYLLYKPDYEKAAADFTELIRLASKEKDEDATMVYILRGLAYAHQEKTLDKAVADLTIALAEKESPGPASEDDHYWAYLVRAAILARQNKNADDLALALKDVEKVLSVHRGAEAYAIAVAICEKEGNHAKAAELRETAKRKTEKPIECDGLEADFAAAAHDCVVKILPEIEKK